MADTTSPPSAGRPGATPPAAAGDPSMEDILASIRRILNEDDPAAPAPADAGTAPADEPLDLTRDMLVNGPAAVPAAEPPASAQVRAADYPPAAVPPPPTAVPAADALLAPAVAAAASASLGSLLRAVASERGSAVRSGGPTIEDVVREELRPLLKEWLDRHLPAVVERLARAEIERVVGRALS